MVIFESFAAGMTESLPEFSVRAEAGSDDVMAAA